MLEPWDCRLFFCILRLLCGGVPSRVDLDGASLGSLGGGSGAVLGGVARESTEEAEGIGNAAQALHGGQFTVLSQEASKVRHRGVGRFGGVSVHRLLALVSGGRTLLSGRISRRGGWLSGGGGCGGGFRLAGNL